MTHTRLQNRLSLERTGVGVGGDGHEGATVVVSLEGAGGLFTKANEFLAVSGLAGDVRDKPR